MGEHLSGVLVSTGVDWITATCKQFGIEPLRDIALGLAEVELSGENNGRPWKTGGYEGFAVGHVQYGEREDGGMLRVGGHLAHAHWQRIARVADNITRLDVEATFRVNRPPAQVIHGHYKQLRKHNANKKRGPSVAMLLAHDGSRTVYSGRRASTRFGRIYDKGNESKLSYFDGCVRYELEIKGKACLGHVRAINAGSEPGAQAGLLACRFFTDRSCSLGSLGKSFFPLTSRDVLVVPAGRSNLEVQLEWLAKSVSRTLKRAIEARGLDEVFRKMGLSESLRFSTVTS